MPTYIRLMNLTEAGVQNIKDVSTQLKNARERASEMGAEVVAFYLTMGRYDAVAIVKAPDAETSAVMALRVAGVGNVRTESLVAFDESQLQGIVDRL